MTDEQRTGNEGYELEPVDSTQATAQTRAAPRVDVSDHAADDEDDLPPPISCEANPQVWWIVAGACAAVLVVSWLAGAPQLVIPEPSSGDAVVIAELSIMERLAGVARTLVYLPLATLGAVFGLLCLAFMHQRPVGDAVALFAKCAAIIALGMLVWLVPCDIRFIKQTLNVLGVPAVAGALAIPLFRLAPRDALLTTAFALMGMLLLVLASATVVWAVGA